jgi:hypothetical protein
MGNEWRRKLLPLVLALGILVLSTLPRVPSGAASVLFQDGFESGSFSAWTNSATTAGESATVTSARARHGSYSAGFSTNGDGGYENAYCYRSITPMNYLYARCYVYVSQSGILDVGDRLFFIIFRSGARAWPTAAGRWMRMVPSDGV